MPEDIKRKKQGTENPTCYVCELPTQASELCLPLLVLSQLLVFLRGQPHDHPHHERLHLQAIKKGTEVV